MQSHLGYLLSGPLHLQQPITTSNFQIAILYCQSHDEDACFWNSQSISAADENLNNDVLKQYVTRSDKKGLIAHQILTIIWRFEIL